MKSLQSKETIDQFTERCRKLWARWTERKPADRLDDLNDAIEVATESFLYPVLLYARPNSPDHGSFSYRSWNISLAQASLDNNDISYGDFIEMGVTVYHETRHAEQYFRVAQGLASGKLMFPGHTERWKEYTAAEIKKLTDINDSAVDTAVRKKTDINEFFGLPWMKHTPDGWRDTVQEWMEFKYRPGRNYFKSAALKDNPKKVIEEQFYWRGVHEIDARTIEELAKTALTAHIGYQFETDKNRKISVLKSICHNCGAERFADARFCTKCGTRSHFAP